MNLGFLTTSERRLATKPADRPTAARQVPTRRQPLPAFGALAALRNAKDAAPAPNFITSLVLAIVSLGAAPALLWPMRFRRSAAADRRSLMELARWGKARSNDVDGAALLAAAHRVRFFPSLMTLGMAGVVAAMGAVAWGITQIPSDQNLLTWLAGLTYGALWPRYSTISFETFGVFSVWTLGLTLAYASHLAQSHLYALSLRRFLDEFNKLAIAEGYSPVMLEPIGFCLLSPWLFTGVALAMLSGAWAIPMALAGATDSRLRRRAIWRMRAALAGRVRDMIFSRPLTIRTIDLHLRVTAWCITDGCATPLPTGVRFCPRCGAKTGTSIDRRA